MISPAATATTELAWRELAWRRQARQVALATAGAVLGLGLSGCMGATPVPMGGLSVSVDASGDRIVLIRQLEGRSELVLYRRSLQSLQPIAMAPPAVPVAVQLRADGRELALQVSRDGLWQVDLIQLP